ncbi:electron transfer flavoprotein subunit alpha/FixB family protein [Paraburkholderia bonniea]|uniref:electron transfer flavoprotein subunit alpha/FixB family protein n=1 Tax=Paraburkholderia bonniea TaxID=2152891 RepID=UPI001292B2C3|nr:electron transfer flavoprotein subunit alpha/FixB family protein [Paraburkholderia bonniea]
MNAPLKRINPRRPYVLTSGGLRRITLGALSSAGEPGTYQENQAHQAHQTSHTGQHPAAKPRRTSTAPQRALLAVVQSERGGLDEHARQVCAAAALIADASTQVVLLVFGELKDDAAALGADKVIVLPDFDTRAFRPEHALQTLVACVAQIDPAHILMPDTLTGTGDLGRRFAASAGVSIACHVVELDASHVSVYVQAQQHLASRALPTLILLEPGTVDTRLPFAGAGERIELAGVTPRGTHHAAYQDHGIEEVDVAQLALAEADFIVSAGHGVTDISSFEALASAFGAAIGASRVAVDNGHFSRERQIGATGTTVEASVVIAFGISGAVQHLQGIKDCRHVIAVNLDSSAPMVKRANLTIIDDAQTLMAALLDALASAKTRAQSGPTAPPLPASAVLTATTTATPASAPGQASVLEGAAA